MAQHANALVGQRVLRWVLVGGFLMGGLGHETARGAAAEQEASITVRTTLGAFVDVSVSEIRRAYQLIPQPSLPPYDGFYWNSDGSAVIVGPKFVYRGEALAIHSKSSGEGICRLFGFGRFLGGRSQAGRRDLVKVNSEGMFSGLVSDPGLYDWEVKEITCYN